MALRHRPGHQSLPQRRQHYTDFVAAALAESMRQAAALGGRVLLWQPGTQQELWAVIAGISGFDE